MAETTTTTTKLDVMEPPPRMVGEPLQDLAALGQWVDALYKNLIVAGGVVQTVKQSAKTIDSTGQITAFPVGALFLSTVDTDPAELLGYGTWERRGNGRAIVGVDETDPDFTPALKTGGAKTVTPTGTVAAPLFTGTPLGTHSHGVGTIAASAHVLTTHGATTGADFDAVTAIADHTMSGSTAAVTAGTPAGSNSAPAFTGDPVSTVQPYIVIYIWERTE